MTTTTVFATTAAGNVNSDGTVYADVRAGSSLAITTGIIVGQDFNSPTYEAWEAFLDFDTSPIPDSDLISSATVSLNGQADNSVTNFTAEARLHDWGGTLETADWVAGDDFGSKTLLATWSSVGYSVDYNDFTSEAAFVDNISKTGTTYILVCSDRHRLATTPTGDEFIQFNDASAAGTTQDPKLVVVHTASSKGPPARISHNQAVMRAATW